MNEHINIEQATKLINNKKTTTEDYCAFLHEDIKTYQIEREKFHLENFRQEHQDDQDDVTIYREEYTKELVSKIEKDVKLFTVKYATNSIDVVLDAMNQKRFTTKKRPKEFLTILCTLKEVGEEN